MPNGLTKNAEATPVEMLPGIFEMFSQGQPAIDRASRLVVSFDVRRGAPRAAACASRGVHGEFAKPRLRAAGAYEIGFKCKLSARHH